MKFSSMSKRFAATGAATALAAGALVGLTGSAATAAPVTTTYTCEYAALGLGPWTVTVDSEAPGIEGFPSIAAGFDAPGGLLTITNHFTIPSDARAALQGASVEDIAFPDYAGGFGTNEVLVEGMTAKVSTMTDNGDGTYSFDSNGLNAPFSTPAAGTYDITTPDAFNMVATVPGIGDVSVPCTLAEGTEVASYHTIEVTKNVSTAKGVPVKSTLKVGKVAKMKVTVKADNETPGGKVLVKEGSKTLGKAHPERRRQGDREDGQAQEGQAHRQGRLQGRRLHPEGHQRQDRLQDHQVTSVT